MLWYIHQLVRANNKSFKEKLAFFQILYKYVTYCQNPSSRLTNTLVISANIIFSPEAQQQNCLNRTISFVITSHYLFKTQWLLHLPHWL